MGGKALKQHGITTRRYEDDEYKEICKEVLNDMGSLFPKNEFHIVQAYKNKKTHGDMDIVMKCFYNDDFNKICEIVKQKYNPKAVNKNDGVFSFDYKDFQIDLIRSGEDYFDYQCSAMNVDPSFNLQGKISHKFGLSFKHTGLYYVFRNFSGRVSKDILLTRDIRKSFEFLGFDYDRYLQGFDELEEIFEFILDSKYFNFEFFKLENLTQKDRKRNRKRSTYNAFVEYCNKKLEIGYNLKADRSELYEGKNYAAGFKFSKDKEIYLQKIDTAFPDVKLLDKLEKFKIKDKEIQECAEKFNGKIVMSIFPELEGKELGRFMKDLKTFMGISHDSKCLREVILPMSPEQIFMNIVEFKSVFDEEN